MARRLFFGAFGVYVLIVVLSVSGSTNSYLRVQEKDNDMSLVFEAFISVDSPESKVLKVEVWQDEFFDLLILLCNSVCDPWNTIGGVYVPFSFLVDTLFEYNLDGKPPMEYVIETGNVGSTYGLSTIIIIWYWKYRWHITAAPFELGYIEDIDSDGVYEISDYRVPGKHVYEYKEVYKFHNGGFVYITTLKNE